jgi:hypothetical protein
VICSGPQREKQSTFALLDEVSPAARALERDEALAELACRYLAGHAPATANDLAWWSGLTLSDCRAAFALAGNRICAETIDSAQYWRPAGSEPASRKNAGTYLLPGFDEILLGYRDRSATLDPEHRSRIVPGGNGMFRSGILVDGRIRGTWNRKVVKGAIAISLSWFPVALEDEPPDVKPAVEQYGAYLGERVSLAET